MYTLVLMTSLSAAPDAVEFNGFFRRLFSFGGHSCCGGSCTGSGAGTGSRLRAYGTCCGGSGRGYGSCSGSSFAAGSCTGSGYLPCSGGGQMSAPMGFDPGLAIPSTATQYYYPSYYPMSEPGGCFGSGLGGSMPMMTNPNIPPVPGLGQPYSPPTPAIPGEVNDTPGRNTSFAAGGGRATVVVKLPTDAVLYAEGRRLNLAGGERTFTTPPLPTGDWGYTFRAEYTRDGETISRTKRIGVKPGDTQVIEFVEAGLARTTKLESAPFPPALKTASVPTVVPPPGAGIGRGGPEPATLTIKLPPGATLTVDGKRLDRSGEFKTPPLTPGKEYTYKMQAELMSNGRPERTETTLPVRAGELVTLNVADMLKK